MGPEYMLNAAKKKAEDLGVNAHIIAQSLNDVETKDAAAVFAYMAREIELHGRPFKPPCALLCGGELVVTVGRATGIGGRNQEFALSTATIIDGTKNIVIASADSDGTDGPTDAAGGIVDSHTMKRTAEAGIDIFEELGNHNSYQTLNRLGDNIITGARGTNVRDLRIVYISD
jgi:glycerate 2-kinase